MHKRTALSVLLALLSTAPLATAQDEPGKAQASVGQVKAMDAGKIQPGTPLEFSVRGLTQDNVDTIKKSLMALENQVYACPGCKHEQAAAGRCLPCALELKSKQHNVLFEVLPSLENETLRVTPLAARTLRYSDLQRVLAKASIQIDETSFVIPGKAHLVLQGGTLEDSKVIEKGLRDSKLFDKVSSSFDAAAGEILISTDAGISSPLRAKVITTIDALGTKAKLSDVIWLPVASPAKA